MPCTLMKFRSAGFPVQMRALSLSIKPETPHFLTVHDDHSKKENYFKWAGSRKCLLTSAACICSGLEGGRGGGSRFGVRGMESSYIVTLDWIHSQSPAEPTHLSWPHSWASPSMGVVKAVERGKIVRLIFFKLWFGSPVWTASLSFVGQI